MHWTNFIAELEPGNERIIRRLVTLIQNHRHCPIIIIFALCIFQHHIHNIPYYFAHNFTRKHLVFYTPFRAMNDDDDQEVELHIPFIMIIELVFALSFIRPITIKYTTSWLQRSNRKQKAAYSYKEMNQSIDPIDRKWKIVKYFEKSTSRTNATNKF